jgi:hypothetical protein
VTRSRGELEGGLELGDIGGEGVGLQPHGGAVGDEDAPPRHFLGLQDMAQEAEGVAEAGATHVGRVIGPEEIGELVAGTPAVTMALRSPAEGETGEQEPGLPRAEVRDRPAVSHGPQVAQQLDPPW